MTEKTTADVLTIHSGIHQDANMELPDNALLLVGAAKDCDIRLADENIHAHHFAISMSGGEITLRSIDGDLAINGKAAGKGETIPYVRNQAVTLPESVVAFAIGRTHSNPGDDPADIQTTVKQHPLGRIAVILVLSLLVACVYYLNIVTSEASAHSQDTNISAQSLITELNIGQEVQFIEPTSGTIPIVRGVLDEQMGSLFKQRLADAAVKVNWEITYIEVLLEQVRDVFRINGYSVELDYLEGGKVEVENLDGSNDEVVRIAQHVRGDIPALHKLVFSGEFTNTLNENSPSVYALLPGKRLTTIVDGDTAYIATEDGSRYFVGSVLPGGSQIRLISDAGVQVDFNGTLTWMRF